MADAPNQENQEPQKDQMQSAGPKIKAGLEEIQQFASQNTKDAVAYLVLFIGILLSAFGNFYGAVMIGLVAGAYYSCWIISRLKKISHLVETEGIFKSFVAMGTLLGFLMASPGIFLGMGISVAVNYVLALNAPSCSTGQTPPSSQTDQTDSHS
ncbi:MAG: hypothetical protein K0S07_905 [Chlamydiales bacterium]|jgi:uncharacterized membrane protein|nr:hypothetical protein [Chlamydiales bacterium]